MSEGAAACGNMSAPPRTTVSYGGLAEHARSKVGQPATGLYGTPVRFGVPHRLAARSPATILRTLGLPADPEPAARLRQLIEARAAELPLPEGCAVIPAAPGHAAPWPDALSGLAVLTKCSATVWLRCKTPLLGAGQTRDEVSLLVPPAFAASLPGGAP